MEKWLLLRLVTLSPQGSSCGEGKGGTNPPYLKEGPGVDWFDTMPILGFGILGVI